MIQRAPFHLASFYAASSTKVIQLLQELFQHALSLNNSPFYRALRPSRGRQAGRRQSATCTSFFRFFLRVNQRVSDNGRSLTSFFGQRRENFVCVHRGIDTSGQRMLIPSAKARKKKYPKGAITLLVRASKARSASSVPVYT